MSVDLHRIMMHMEVTRINIWSNVDLVNNSESVGEPPFIMENILIIYLVFSF